MKILVTGANGFLGSWLVNRLKNDGHEVSVLLRKKADLEIYQSLGYRVFQGDVTDQGSLVAAVQGQQQIYHVAGIIAYDRSKVDLLNQVNVQGTENVLRAAVSAQVQRLLLVSSAAAVGASCCKEVLTETSEYKLKPLAFSYHESKRKAEDLLRKYVVNGQIDGVIVNPSTIYGAGDASKNSRSIQLTVAQGKVFYYPPGGVSVVAVEDVVEGMIQAMEKGASAERYLLTGENLTLKEVFDFIAEAAHVSKPWLPIPPFVLKGLAHFDEGLQKLGSRGPMASERARVATMFHWYEASKARRELGYTTRPAKEAIGASVRWMSEQGLLRKQ